ncbi:THUMP domain-containing class I SAM-dependent RNA methyltransferase [Salipiger marinus]|uniref:Putative N6-adenine-specific DNA methylase n=1 Tax=Salipiger marinus TaxID=555512 RepID=A0A1G8Q3M9_9RHOB|nr:RNA methyltransferase [Salipiger marinus]SDI99374.1 putative N6-adenine-specific DNA methylase [Salipiger marinus]
MEPEFEIFLACAPGLEPLLAAEAGGLGFAGVTPQAGGVSLRGGWREVARANLELRGAARVLARIGGFPALHLAQLDKRARKFPWGEVLRPDMPVRVEVVTSRRSKIYHAGAAKERIERAITEELGAPLADDGVRILARIDDNVVTFSVDTSGELLHRRGHKQAVGKAPMRETLAALFLRACGYDGSGPVLDPMCGSGTFVIEAAEIAAGLQPGRGRGFDLERLAVAEAALDGLRRPAPRQVPGVVFHGSDRDQGAVRGAGDNAARAGVQDWCRFACQPVSALERPEGPPGLVMVNPPYGARIGEKGPLAGLHAALGQVLHEKFRGWRVGIVTSEQGLAKATGLPFQPPGPHVAHGSLKVRLWQTGPLR